MLPSRPGKFGLAPGAVHRVDCTRQLQREKGVAVCRGKRELRGAGAAAAEHMVSLMDATSNQKLPLWAALEMERIMLHQLSFLCAIPSIQAIP